MKLYDINEDDIKFVLDQGKREILSGGRKVTITHSMKEKFKYPIKVIGIEKGKEFLLVTAYPLKKGKK
jgi:hypothetical protein